MTRLCPACGSPGVSRFSENIDASKISSLSYASRKLPELMHYALSECEGCLTLFTEASLETEKLLENYRDALFDSHIESEFAAKTYCNYLNKFRIINGKHILDIGCGDGTFLKLSIKLGAKSVQGIEPSQGAFTSASEMKQFIEVSSIEKTDYCNKFDVATCFQTLEHVQDPMMVISKMIKSVCIGGYIAVVCHDRSALANRILGQKSPIFDIEHLQMFTANGLQKLLCKSGLEIVLAKHIINVYPVGYWLRLAPMPKAMKLFFEKKRESVLLRFCVAVPVGNFLIIGQKLTGDLR